MSYRICNALIDDGSYQKLYLIFLEEKYFENNGNPTAYLSKLEEELKYQKSQQNLCIQRDLNFKKQTIGEIQESIEKKRQSLQKNINENRAFRNQLTLLMYNHASRIKELDLKEQEEQFNEYLIDSYILELEGLVQDGDRFQKEFKKFEKENTPENWLLLETKQFHSELEYIKTEIDHLEDKIKTIKPLIEKYNQIEQQLLEKKQ